MSMKRRSTCSSVDRQAPAAAVGGEGAEQEAVAIDHRGRDRKRRDGRRARQACGDAVDLGAEVHAAGGRGDRRDGDESHGGVGETASQRGGLALASADAPPSPACGRGEERCLRSRNDGSVRLDEHGPDLAVRETLDLARLDTVRSGRGSAVVSAAGSSLASGSVSSPPRTTGVPAGRITICRRRCWRGTRAGTCPRPSRRGARRCPA